jgi:predicted O-methyltransferase YrrM
MSRAGENGVASDYFPNVDPVWVRTENYHDGLLLNAPSGVTDAARRNKEEGLPDIAAPPSQAKLMQLIAKSIGAKRILEVGTLGGCVPVAFSLIYQSRWHQGLRYSSIWLALSLPSDGKLITLELDERYADIARRNHRHAGTIDKVTVLVDPAEVSLRNMGEGKNGSFDMVFVDADKPGYVGYFRHAKRLVRKGGVIISSSYPPFSLVRAADVVEWRR